MAKTLGYRDIDNHEACIEQLNILPADFIRQAVHEKLLRLQKAAKERTGVSVFPELQKTMKPKAKSGRKPKEVKKDV